MNLADILNLITTTDFPTGSAIYLLALSTTQEGEQKKQTIMEAKEHIDRLINNLVDKKNISKIQSQLKPGKPKEIIKRSGAVKKKSYSSKIYPEQPCALESCKEPFRPIRKSQIFCSDKCGKLASRLKARDRKKSSTNVSKQHAQNERIVSTTDRPLLKYRCDICKNICYKPPGATPPFICSPKCEKDYKQDQSLAKRQAAKLIKESINLSQA